MTRPSRIAQTMGVNVRDTGALERAFRERTGAEAQCFWAHSPAPATRNRASGASGQDVALFGVMTNVRSNVPIGMFHVTFRLGRDGRVHAHRESHYHSETQPKPPQLAQNVRAFLDEAVYRPARVSVETLDADFVGRYAWARTHDFDRNMRYREGNQTVSAVQLARNNLRRFLGVHGIREDSLYLQSDTGARRPIRSVDELERPSDFAQLRGPREIVIRPLLGEERPGRPILGEEQRAHLGKAFMTSDNTPQPGERHVVLHPDGYQYSAYSMPGWRGVRRIE